MEDETKHIPVLLTESIASLCLQRGSRVVDATGGLGGHSARILEAIGEDGTLLIIDQDPLVCEKLVERFRTHSGVTVVCENFRHIARIIEEQNFSHPHAILADLGWNSEQFKHGGKGFSFLVDEPLAMTFGARESYAFTATDIVNSWSEETIADVLFGYGEERYARRIARRIVEVRDQKPILTTSALAAVVKEATPHTYHRGRIHPATKTFQALRIAVNDELDALKNFISGSVDVLRERGRLAIISFHSIEDRIVKRAFRELKDQDRGILIFKRPVTPSKEEVAQNPRARSAKLRVFELHQ